MVIMCFQAKKCMHQSKTFVGGNTQIFRVLNSVLYAKFSGCIAGLQKTHNLAHKQVPNGIQCYTLSQPLLKTD